MRCASCGAENPEHARFCLECAAPFGLRCPSCGTELPSNAKFCLECAQPVASPAPARDPRAYTPKHLAERILQSKSALEGERKHVTVLFADLAESTPLSASLDPEEMHALMDRSIQLMLAEVHRFEGQVNQFTGDGIMALFGAPIALEHGPLRAVQAALAIQEALQPLHDEVQSRHGVGFRMRIGIHCGTVVVGKIGDDLRMDYTAVGDTTNLADRLQKVARPGGVVISEAAERLVSGFFDARALRPVRVRGIAEPIRTFEVLSERPISGRIEAAAGAGLTPFVGRERELDALWAAFEAAREGHGQVAFVVGEAGMGKSRLRYEFRRRLESEPHTWVEGRCESYARNTVFYPIADGLKRLFGLEEQDDDATALVKLQRAEEAAGGGLEWTLPFVRQLLSLPVGDSAVAQLDAATRRSETFRALQAHFLRAAERQPLVLVVEDLHWIDMASEEFLTFLAESVPASRALLLFMYRPGYRHPFGDRSYHVRIALQALSEHETAAIAGSVLETSELRGELRQLIAQKAEGNPFFVEEVTKSLLEEGALRREDGHVGLARDLADISVPDSIQDVLAARIDRLAEEPKRAMQVASVIGREFALRLLQRISEAGERVSSIVGELRALELILEKAAYPELAFMFKHALTHTVAYESILTERRKALHRAVGTAIEELYRDRLAEHYEALALHFTLSEEWERSFLYHERAAEKAAATYANQSAAEHCRQALAIAERLGDPAPEERRRRLREILGFACMYLTEYEESADAFLKASEDSLEPEGRGMNLGRAAYSHFMAHSYERADELAQRTVSFSRTQQVPAIEAFGILEQAYFRAVKQGDMKGYERGIAEALRLARSAGNDEVLGHIRYCQGELAEWSGDYERAIRLQEETVAIGHRAHLALFVIFGNWFIGKATCCKGEYGRALKQIRAGLELADRIGDRAWKSRLLNTLGWCFAELGSYGSARLHNEQAVAIARDIGDDEIIANAEINLGRNHLALAELDEALQYLEPLHAGLERRDPWMRWRYSLHLFDALAHAALARLEPERALELATAELAGARRHRARKIEACALELRGRVLAVLDRREEARKALRAAIETAEKIAYPPVIWHSRALLAEVARRSGDRSAADRQATEARALVSKLAASLPEAELQRELRRLAETSVAEPLGAYR